MRVLMLITVMMITLVVNQATAWSCEPLQYRVTIPDNKQGDTIIVDFLATMQPWDLHSEHFHGTRDVVDLTLFISKSTLSDEQRFQWLRTAHTDYEGDFAAALVTTTSGDESESRCRAAVLLVIDSFVKHIPLKRPAPLELRLGKCSFVGIGDDAEMVLNIINECSTRYPNLVKQQLFIAPRFRPDYRRRVQSHSTIPTLIIRGGVDASTLEQYDTEPLYDILDCPSKTETRLDKYSDCQLLSLMKSNRYEECLEGVDALNSQLLAAMVQQFQIGSLRGLHITYMSYDLNKFTPTIRTNIPGNMALQLTEVYMIAPDKKFYRDGEIVQLKTNLDRPVLWLPDSVIALDYSFAAFGEGAISCIDTYLGIPSKDTFRFSTKPQKLQMIQEQPLFQNDSVLISTTLPYQSSTDHIFSSYQWSNGCTRRSQMVTKTGWYYVRCFDETVGKWVSDSILVQGAHFKLQLEPEKTGGTSYNGTGYRKVALPFNPLSPIYAIFWNDTYTTDQWRLVGSESTSYVVRLMNKLTKKVALSDTLVVPGDSSIVVKQLSVSQHPKFIEGLNADGYLWYKQGTLVSTEAKCPISSSDWYTVYGYYIINNMISEPSVIRTWCKAATTDINGTEDQQHESTHSQAVHGQMRDQRFIGETTLELWNSLGQLVLRTSKEENESLLSVESLRPGTYLVHLPKKNTTIHILVTD